jgi:hypothetical protein
MHKPDARAHQRPRQRRPPGMNPQRTNQGHGVTRDTRGQDQPADRTRAQQASGEAAQRDAAVAQPPAPGQPAGGE